MITKLDAAARQLNTAIRLFFENRDRLSVYTLSTASREITDDLIESKRGKVDFANLKDSKIAELSFREATQLVASKLFKDFRVVPINRASYQNAFLALMRRAQNFLKHANKDPDAEMSELTVKELALHVGFAIRNYILLDRGPTEEMAVFLAWFLVAEPNV